MRPAGIQCSYGLSHSLLVRHGDSNSRRRVLVGADPCAVVCATAHFERFNGGFLVGFGGYVDLGNCNSQLVQGSQERFQKY